MKTNVAHLKQVILRVLFEQFVTAQQRRLVRASVERVFTTV